jgi:hypothetical protein
MNPSIDFLDTPGSPNANASSALSNASMDSVDLLSSPGAASASSLGQIHEDEQMSMSINAPPQAAFVHEQCNSQSQQHRDHNPVVYQMEFDVDHLGKNKPASKRKASWTYGIRRVSSTDNSIKIEEHEAQLTWSTHSGRWTVSVDGTEVYAGIAKGSVLDYKWKWNHIAGCVADDDGPQDKEPIISMRIVACRKPPVRSSKDFRCYEFVVEGKPFRHLPTVNGSGSEEIDFENEYNDGKLTTILDIIEPTWRASGFA